MEQERDMIAAFAMQGLLAHARPYRPSDAQLSELKTWHKCLAAEAYEIADAMLEARKC